MKYEEFELVGRTLEMPMALIKISWEMFPFKDHDLNHGVFVFFNSVKEELEKSPGVLETLQKIPTLEVDEGAWKQIADKMRREFGPLGAETQPNAE